MDGDIVLLAEADVEPDQLAHFIGDGHEMHMLYTFLLGSYLFLAQSRESGAPVKKPWELLPDKPEVG